MESQSTQVVATELILTCGLEDTPLAGGLSFDAHDALAVSLHLSHGIQDVVWTFGRDLLAEGVFEPAGDGDVHVWPCLNSSGESVVLIELNSPDGELIVQAPTRQVREFLAETERVVPRGSEVVDVDALLSQLFAA